MDTRPRPPELQLPRRIGALVLLMLQLVGATVFSAADGKLDVEGYTTSVHVEPRGSDECAPHHDHVFCQAVRSTMLANPARSNVEVVIGAELPVVPMIPDAAPHHGRFAARSGAASPRAPPSV